jgi:DivIVA domain-containing protein
VVPADRPIGNPAGQGGPASIAWGILGLMVENESSKPQDNTESSPATGKPERSFRDVRHYVPQDILDVSFPVSVRGYDRHAVDTYVKRVNRVIAEVKVSASPPAAVRHALDQAQEKVEALLQAAREAAEEMTTSARREADESSARAKAEAADLMVNTSAEADRVKAETIELLASSRAEAEAIVARAKSDANEIVSEATTKAQDTQARVQAEADERRRQLHDELTRSQEQAQTRMQQIHADTEAIGNRRSQFLNDIRAMANGLVELADAAAARVQPADVAEEATTEMHSRSGDELSSVAEHHPSQAPTSDLDQRDTDARDNADETTSSPAR